LHSSFEIDSYKELYLFINRLTYLADYDIMCDLFDLAIKKNHHDFAAKIFNFKDSCSLFNRTILFNLDNNTDNINIINGCLFVVEDINTFISKIRNKGYIINAGPQK
jgi:hypothetical protein